MSCVEKKYFRQREPPEPPSCMSVFRNHEKVTKEEGTNRTGGNVGYEVTGQQGLGGDGALLDDRRKTIRRTEQRNK